jgi:formylglycine-generating enzyme required for sulfatase activity
MKKFLLIFGTLSLFITALVQAQNDRVPKVNIPEQPQDLERRVALVIGNGDYDSVGKLKNPVNDAIGIAEVLSKVGFKVTLKTNQNRRQMIEAIQEFGEAIKNGGVGVFYFSGHGVQVNGDNYLIPVSAAIKSESEVPYEAVNAGMVLAQMEDARNRLNVIILDACRNNPFARSSRSGEKGLRIMNAPVGTFIGFATAPGQVALDYPDPQKPTDNHSPYAAALIKFIPEVGLKIEDVFKRVLTSVRQQTGNAQSPWITSSFEGDFCFVGNCGAVMAQPTTQPTTIPTPTNPLKQEHVEIQTYTETVKDVGIELVRIPSGKFIMGSPSNETYRQRDEGPQHEVMISSFYMGKYEVTQLQWRAVLALPKVAIDLPVDPSNNNGDNLPVETVSWNEAVEFCERLSKATGKIYRLPTEAEWEYACRAGTTGMYVGNVGSMAWYDEATTGSTHPVGQKKANGFGLYDMLGNVWEWCADWYDEYYYGSSPKEDPKGPVTGSFRVYRGGSWRGGERWLRSAYRISSKPTERENNRGFRIARSYN